MLRWVNNYNIKLWFFFSYNSQIFFLITYHYRVIIDSSIIQLTHKLLLLWLLGIHYRVTIYSILLYSMPKRCMFMLELYLNFTEALWNMVIIYQLYNLIIFLTRRCELLYENKRIYITYTIMIIISAHSALKRCVWIFHRGLQRK